MRRPAVFRPRRRLARVVAPIGVLALVSAVAAGCSSDDSDNDNDSGETKEVAVTALTADQIAEAVLQDDNLGEGWVSQPYTENDDSAPGCLADIDALTDGLEKQDKGGTEFSYGDTLSVQNTVTAYADEAAVASVFDQVQTASAACTTVTGPDDDGNTWNLALTYDEDAKYDDVDDQYSISGSGSLTTATGSSFDIYIEVTTVRVGPNVGSLTTFDLQSRTPEHTAWADIAVERLVDVAEGDEPEATTAPAPA